MELVWESTVVVQGNMSCNVYRNLQVFR